MTQPTHEQRLREELDTFLGHYGVGRFLSHPPSLTRHLMDKFKRYEEAKHREFVKEVRNTIQSISDSLPSDDIWNDHENGQYQTVKEILSMPLLQLEETNEK